MINPDYYRGISGTFLWDVIDDFQLDQNFNLACVAKYIFRAGKKPQKGLTLLQSKLKDLHKAKTFLEKEISKLTHQQEENEMDSQSEEWDPLA